MMKEKLNEPTLAPHGSPSEGFHFERRELFQAVAGQTRFEAADRRRALDHFGRGCPTCWQSLVRLAGEEHVRKEFRTQAVDTADLTSSEEAGAPVDRALRRCLVFLSMRREASHEPDSIAGLRPAHRDALVRTLGEEDALGKALAFRRLVLEEGRALTLADPSQLVRRLEVTLAELSDPGFAALDGCGVPMTALDALGKAYLADDYRVTGRYEKARAGLAEAKKLLDLRPSDSEIYATYYELEADLARVGNEPFQALRSLRHAETMLESCPIPARRAETRIRLGLLLAQSPFEDLEAASKRFRAALCEIPPAIHRRLRLEALHNLAALEVRCRCFEDARRTLEVAERLYANHSYGSVLAERAWLWGVVHLEAKELEKAEKMLWTGLALFESAGRMPDAARALIDLGCLYTLSGERDKLAQVTLRFVAMTCRPELRELLLEVRRELLCRALEGGFELSSEVRRALGETSEPAPPDELVN